MNLLKDLKELAGVFADVSILPCSDYRREANKKNADVKDVFVFVEENSNSNDVVKENRTDAVDRINNIVNDLILDNKNYKQFLITNVNDDNKIIKGINEFIGTFMELQRA